VERDVVMQRGQLLARPSVNITNELDTVAQNMNTEIISEVEYLNEKIAEIAHSTTAINLVEISGQTANAGPRPA